MEAVQKDAHGDALGEIEAFMNARKYHQMTLRISEVLASGAYSSEDLLSLYHTYILPNYYNLHPDSLSELACSLSEVLSDKAQAMDMLENILVLLVDKTKIGNAPDETKAGRERSSRRQDKEKPNGEDLILAAIATVRDKPSAPITRILLQIAKQHVENGEQMLRAKHILYDCSKMPLEANELLSKFYYGMGMLHFRGANHSLAFHNFVDYISVNMAAGASDDLLEKCVISGILSKDAYNFNRLFGLNLTHNRAAGPVEVLARVNSGDLQWLLENRAKIEGAMCGWDADIFSIIMRKAKIILLLNHFFNNQLRIARICDLSKKLDMGEDEIELLILDILGLGLVRGHLDGVDGVFYYDWIGYKVLTRNEISSAREVITKLRERVDRVIKEFD